MFRQLLKGLAESHSDGIIQVSTGGGVFASGSSVKDMALGAMSIAEHVHRVAERYPIYVALVTDHCLADKLDQFVIPLVEETERRRVLGQPSREPGPDARRMGRGQESRNAPTRRVPI